MSLDQEGTSKIKSLFIAVYRILVYIVEWFWMAWIEFILHDSKPEDALQKCTWYAPAASGHVSGTRVELNQVKIKHTSNVDVGSSAWIASLHKSFYISH